MVMHRRELVLEERGLDPRQARKPEDYSRQRIADRQADRIAGKAIAGPAKVKPYKGRPVKKS